ncbi:MAG: hypothetical protein KDI34_03360 [Halioglobus sp.]|nr:hypothetical protein [Halioglobus sp.]
MAMTIREGHFQLTPEQRRFRDLLMPYPTLARYWDWQTRCCDEAGLDAAMGVLSHGEKLMATFFRNVWTGGDRPPLGLIEAVNTLDTEDLSVIIGWMRDPFFP